MNRKETKLNGYILPDSIKNDMRNVLDKTQTLEEGFGLCTKDNIIRRGKDFIGSSDRIPISLILGSCNKDEKLLGIYHTHPISGSRPSAEDIHNCGKFKIICTGGKSGNKIGCLTYKGEQISVPEYVRILYDISQGIMKTENPKYQPNVDCINDTLPSYLAEMYITEKLDKDIRDRKSRLSSLRIEERIDLDASEALRYMYDKILKKETKKQSNKYYNETKIM